MRLLTVRHLTTYRYSQPVRLGEHRMTVRPRESHDLRLRRMRLEITPEPSEVRWVHDVFDNSVAVVNFERETTELRFLSTATLEHHDSIRPDYRLDPDARKFPFAYSEDERPDLIRALRRYHPAVDVSRWAAGFRAVTGPTKTMDLLTAMTRGIRDQFTYSRRYEQGVQTPSETLLLRRGTCRDFALLMMEGVRSLGLAARFVSGYIFIPDEHPNEVDSGGNTHAWLQVYLPGAGWVDFDPTNSIIGNRNLIRVAVAWEPAQALPLWGTFFGRPDSSLGMEVSVSVHEEIDNLLPEYLVQ